MSDVVTTLTNALPVIAGGIVTGLFALAMQRGTRKAEHARWEREATERRRTHFHDTRLTAYTELLAWASNAHGYLLHKVIGQRRQNDVEAPVSGPAVAEHPEFNSDAARQMLRRQSLVRLLSSSADTRDAARELVDAVIAVAAISADDPACNSKITASVERVTKAHNRFEEAANAELAR